jgi:hypothetical protein
VRDLPTVLLVAVALIPEAIATGWRQVGPHDDGTVSEFGPGLILLTRMLTTNMDDPGYSRD